MARFTVACALLMVACAFAADRHGDPAPPKWPSQYHASGIFSIPYFDIVEPVEVWFDGVNNRERFDYYYGMDSYNWRFDLGVLYEVVPRIDALICMKPNISGPMVTVLPDLTNWTYSGREYVNGYQSDRWMMNVTNMGKTAYYTMFVSADDQRPVRLLLNGYDFVFGSHPDIYIFDYKQYEPSIRNASVFSEPAICVDQPHSPMERGLRARMLLGRLAILTPPQQTDDAFHLFMMKHKKAYGGEEEYWSRRANFERNQRMIDEHNAKPDATYKMAMNQFGDMTDEEMRAVIRPRPKMSRAEAISKLKFSRTHTHSGKTLPAEVDWVMQGAVNPPKDQGACGSCWTFGTVGSVEGVWFVKTGSLPNLAEQQLVDCAWANWGGDGGDMGCDGGYAAPAMQWIVDNGGIATEESYHYLMQDGWCLANNTNSGVVVKGYVNVSSSEAALQDAVATAGPVAIAIDASHPSFTFYSTGTYYEPACMNDLADLDHEVLAVGYGTDLNGQDFWLVKNSWSTHWGDNGFIRMSRNKGNNCGIATQATYPLV